MKPRALLLTTVALLANTAAAQHQVDAKRPLVADGLVRIFVPQGSLRIMGWDRDTVQVTGSLDPAAELSIQGGEVGGRRVKLAIEGLPDDGQTRVAQLEVHVPEKSRVWVEGRGAEVEVSGVVGSLELHMGSGGIRVTGSPQEVNAESMSGAIEIAAQATLVRAGSASGVVTLRGVSGDLEVSTVSGNIAVTGGTFQRAKVQSVVGNIQFTGDFDRGGSCTFESHSGKVELFLPATVAADFEVTTFLASVDNDFGAGLPRTPADARRKELSFSTNAGGAQVSIRTYRGGVVLRKVVMKTRRG